MKGQVILHLVAEELKANDLTGIPDTDISLKDVEKNKVQIQKALNILKADKGQERWYIFNILSIIFRRLPIAAWAGVLYLLPKMNPNTISCVPRLTVSRFDVVISYA